MDVRSDLRTQLNGDADISKQLQEMRGDVRSYATLLIQVKTLLLSTLVIVLGWMAKDFASDRYTVALQQAKSEFGVSEQTAPNIYFFGLSTAARNPPKPLTASEKRELQAHTSALQARTRELYREMLKHSALTPPS